MLFLKILNLLLSTISPYNIEVSQFYNSEVVVSYYERGQITANGERFIPENLTCASPILPFNTKIVFKGVNGIVKVRVNDRGPFNMQPTGEVIYPLEPHSVRKLDLSREAYYRVFGELESGVNTATILDIEFPEGGI